jgi:hypothetical protein
VSWQCLKSLVLANDPSQLHRRGRRRLARLLIETPGFRLDASAQAWLLLEEGAFCSVS